VPELAVHSHTFLQHLQVAVCVSDVYVPIGCLPVACRQTVLQLVSCLSLLCWQAYVTHRDIVRVDEKAVDLMTEVCT
jgi:hypothetical protein